MLTYADVWTYAQEACKQHSTSAAPAAARESSIRNKKKLIALQNSDACADIIRQYTLCMYPRIAAIRRMRCQHPSAHAPSAHAPSQASHCGNQTHTRVVIEEPKLLFIGYNKALAATLEAALCSEASKASNKAAQQDLNTRSFVFERWFVAPAVGLSSALPQIQPSSFLTYLVYMATAYKHTDTRKQT